jgi:hypothetical protein
VAESLPPPITDEALANALARGFDDRARIEVAASGGPADADTPDALEPDAAPVGRRASGPRVLAAASLAVGVVAAVLIAQARRWGSDEPPPAMPTYLGSYCFRDNRLASLTDCGFIDAAGCEAYRNVTRDRDHRCVPRPESVHCRPFDPALPADSLPPGECFESEPDCVRGLPEGARCGEVPLQRAVPVRIMTLTRTETQTTQTRFGTGPLCMIGARDRSIYTCSVTEERRCSRSIARARAEHDLELACVPRPSNVTCAPNGVVSHGGRSVTCYLDAMACRESAPHPEECSPVQVNPPE